MFPVVVTLVTLIFTRPSATARDGEKISLRSKPCIRQTGIGTSGCLESGGIIIVNGCSREDDLGSPILQADLELIQSTGRLKV